MSSSNFTPTLIYVNMPEPILSPTTLHDKELHDSLVSALQELNIPIVSMQTILSAVQAVTARSGRAMPHNETQIKKVSKSQRNIINKDREKFVSEVLRSIKIDTIDTTVKYSFDGNDITSDVDAMSHPHPVDYQQTWVNGINDHLAQMMDLAHPHRLVAFIATDPRRLVDDKLNPIVGVLAPGDSPVHGNGRELRMRKKVDAVITLSANIETLKESLAGVIHDFTELRKQSAKLYEELRAGKIKLEDPFSRDTWPSHAIMANIKKEVRHIVADVIKEKNVTCDALDVEYQVLFRLTSLPISVVFEEGEALQAHLEEHDAFGYWRNILALEAEKVTYPVKAAVIREIVEEQLHIIQDRMQHTTLPLESLIVRQGIFAETGWKLQKYKGKLMAIKTRGETDEIIATKNVSFRPVDINYAKELHSTLHYIHTPRAVKAFGLYLEDDTVPFSVVAFDAIDRPYKKDLLLMHGFNPSKCLDLARLYSRPGTPFNTSSTIFTLAFTYFKENEPDIQAILSAFMPTYAHGMSMISAGFNYGVLVKEWRHSFAEREIHGVKTWELVTKRRKDDTQTTIESQWPLLPVFELMATLQPPRFTPFSELDGRMVSRNL